MVLDDRHKCFFSSNVFLCKRSTSQLSNVQPLYPNKKPPKAPNNTIPHKPYTPTPSTPSQKKKTKTEGDFATKSENLLFNISTSICIWPVSTPGST